MKEFSNKIEPKDKARRIKTIPKYIGFLEYLKTPLITKELALFIFIGLIVVCSALNDLTADIRINGPSIMKISQEHEILYCLCLGIYF